MLKRKKEEAITRLMMLHKKIFLPQLIESPHHHEDFFDIQNYCNKEKK